MKAIAFYIAKGGVGKTVSSLNFAYVLAHDYKKRVLYIDLDTQGNGSKTFRPFTDDQPTVTDLIENENTAISKVILKTRYPNIDAIICDAGLYKANQDILLDKDTVQQTRLKIHIARVAGDYDFCILDCPTSMTMTTLNALALADEVLMPMVADGYTIDGLAEVLATIENMKAYNPKLKYGGCFLTKYQHGSNLNKEIFQSLKAQKNLRAFNTPIRYTVKVSESTLGTPICEENKRATAAQDYRALVKEWLKK